MARRTEYRIRIIPDDSGYIPGDAEDAAECARIEAEHGVYGYVVESRVVSGDLHSDWTHVDSCFGYLGNDQDYILSQALNAVPRGKRRSVDVIYS